MFWHELQGIYSLRRKLRRILLCRIDVWVIPEKNQLCWTTVSVSNLQSYEVPKTLLRTDIFRTACCKLLDKLRDQSIHVGTSLEVLIDSIQVESCKKRKSIKIPSQGKLHITLFDFCAERSPACALSPCELYYNLLLSGSLFIYSISWGYKVARLEKSFKKLSGIYQDLIEKNHRSVKEMVNDSFPG